MEITKSKRLRELPPYIFSEINKFKAQAKAEGRELISLGIGDPDKPTPEAIVKKMQEAIAKPENHPYSPYDGSDVFKQSVAKWFQARFGVSLDANTEVMALIGSKEGIAHFPMAFCDPGDKCLYPNPGYPVFGTSIHLGGGIPVPLRMSADNGFVPELNELEDQMKEHKPRYMIANFPSNPTSATITREQLEGIVALARKHNVIILSDNAYAEIYFDDAHKPMSILEVEGAKECCIEFHSFSKTYNMTGWRIAFAVGNADLVAGLLQAKTNVDSGPLLSVQETAAWCLENYKELSDPIRKVYADRRTVLLDGLKRIGIEHHPLDATFFLWAKTPKGKPSLDMCKELIKDHGLVVTPGMGFGTEGEGFFRLAMTVDIPQMNECLQKLEDWVKKL